MKKTVSIFDLLKNQGQKKVCCPACGLTMPENKLNSHLDLECISSSTTNEIIDYEASGDCKSNTPFVSVISTENTNIKVESLQQTNQTELTHSSVASKPTKNSITSKKTASVKRKKIEKTTENCQLPKETTSRERKNSISNIQNKIKNFDETTDDFTELVSRGSNSPKETVTAKRKYSKQTSEKTQSSKKNILQLERELQKKTNAQNEVETADNSTESLNLVLLNAKLADAQKPSRSSSAPWRAPTEKRKYSDKSTEKSSKKPTYEELNSEEGDVNKHFSEQVENTSDEKSENYVHNPYYLVNFKHIINKVPDDEYNKHLFDSTDLNYIQAYYSLSDSAQKLYVRLFQRKYKWLRPYKINYPQIAEDLSQFLEELVESKFLDAGSDILDLESALNLLSLAETKSISKHFNFNAGGMSKSEINQLLIKHGKQHKSFFFSNDNNTVSNAMLKKIKQIMGPCYRLSLEPKRLFTRILMLFSLPTIAEDDEEAAGGQQQQLFTLLQVNKGELTFPVYNICRQCMIFEKRDDLIRYELARQLENDILNAIEGKKFELGKELYFQAEEELSKLKNSGCSERDKTIPQYLRRYTAGHVYVRCLNQGVEILQKLRQYEEAVELLKKLLNQTLYCQDRRGRWWDRIALNLEQHLKRPEEAAKALKEGLQDNNVRVGHRLALLYRSERIVNVKNEDPSLKLYLSEVSAIIQAPKVTIRGRLLPRAIPGRRHVFISSNSSDLADVNDVTVLGVEELAIEHYKNEGYTEGLHGEGSTFISLYTLLFWDIIYDGSHVDAFISPYQSHPLDLNSDSFYERREDQINNHLEMIRNCSIEDLNGLVRLSWSAHNGNSSLVSWDRFVDVGQMEGLVSCLGNAILAGICERLAKDFRYTRSGVPDLVVWNPVTKLVKIVEVKGPGDKLSPKQILWLDYLLSLGADAEVCLVEAVGSKKLQKK